MFVYSDTRWGLQIHFCFTSELGEILGYNKFLASEIDHPGVRLIVLKKFTFQTIVFMTGFLDYQFYITVTI